MPNVRVSVRFGVIVPTSPPRAEWRDERLRNHAVDVYEEKIINRFQAAKGAQPVEQFVFLGIACIEQEAGTVVDVCAQPRRVAFDAQARCNLRDEVGAPGISRCEPRIVIVGFFEPDIGRDHPAAEAFRAPPCVPCAPSGKPRIVEIGVAKPAVQRARPGGGLTRNRDRGQEKHGGDGCAPWSRSHSGSSRNRSRYPRRASCSTR